MSYTPTEWVTGDTITAEKLNKMESGIASAGGGGAFIVNMDAQTLALNKTWQEICDAMANGQPTYILGVNPMGAVCTPVLLAFNTGAGYSIVGAGSDAQTITVALYTAASADDYPVAQL